MKLKITLLLLTLLCTGLLSSQTVKIGATSYSTITEAITAAVDGDVILITGTFTEPISIDKSITLKGTNPATDIIQAAASPGTGGTGLRAISIGAAAAATLNVKVENLTIRNGNANANGGGINVDKVTGLVTLNNLIIANNYTTTNGGAIGIAGSNVNITNCSMQNNTSLLDGGAIIAAPNNASAVSNVVNINQSLLNANTARNGGGIYINGNSGFGNNYKITVNVENSTISNNSAISPSTGNGGGAVYTSAALWTTVAGGDGVSGNTTLRLVHSTVYNNTHAAAIRAGLRFAGTVGTLTTFSAYNSIIVAADDINIKAVSFANTNTTNVVNCILGGLDTAPVLIDDVAKNNQKGKTATQSGLTGTLSSEGGATQVIKINAGSAAVDFCTAATGITIPTIDQRGYTRSATYDAGAYELAGSLSIGDQNFENFAINVYPNPTQGFVKISGVNNVNVVKVYSILGSLEKEIHSQNEFNVSDLSSGVHIMMIEGDGQKIVKRIIKE